MVSANASGTVAGWTGRPDRRGPLRSGVESVPTWRQGNVELAQRDLEALVRNLAQQSPIEDALDTRDVLAGALVRLTARRIYVLGFDQVVTVTVRASSWHSTMTRCQGERMGRGSFASWVWFPG